MSSPNDEVQAVAAALDSKVVAQSVSNYCAVCADVDQADKELSTIRARLALAGWVMHIVDAGHDRASFWVSRWGRSTTLHGRHELLQFMQQAGVA
jgi:hypothetical protein